MLIPLGTSTIRVNAYSIEVPPVEAYPVIKIFDVCSWLGLNGKCQGNRGFVRMLTFAVPLAPHRVS
jgi:hypothetical protein